MRAIRLDAHGNPTGVTYDLYPAEWGISTHGAEEIAIPEDAVARFPENATVEFTVKHPAIEVLALLFGYSVVDWSINFETHIIRGES